MNGLQTSEAERTGGSHMATAENWEPRIVGFVCNWCTYAGADMAGTARLKYPANIRLVRFPCTGRMSPLMILKAFENGADGVIVSGCHPGDCHYVQGNLVARRRFTVLRSLLDFLGVDLRRVHFSWVSAAEGQKWAKVVEKVTAAVREAGPMPRFEGPAEPLRVDLPSMARASRGQPDPQQLDALRKNLAATAADLLSSGKVNMVIGYTPTAFLGRAAPTMITAPEDAATLEWGEGCHTNLAVYLPAAVKKAGRVAVVLKQCDVRAAVNLLRENQVCGEDVVFIGAPCPGVKDGDAFAAKCSNCDGKPHSMCDVVVNAEGVQQVGRQAEAHKELVNDPRDGQVAYIESLPVQTRWEFWQGQFGRCLRCYACRAACPLCYCESCIAEKNRPQWVSPLIDNRGNTAWNLTRAFHLAGRCIGCDECARACPADIRLDLINHKLRREVEQQFRASGSDAEAKAILVDFRMDDPGDFVL
jgi:coenzyme F420-reducing hydrogenase delta subunit/ferredoxin